MTFAAKPGLWQVLCPFADTATPNPKTGLPEPAEACLVFVRTLGAADRDALADLLPDDWAERVRLIFAECVCDERGVCPPPDVLAGCFARFDLATTEKVHRLCCAANQLEYMEYPKDEPVPA